MFVLVLGALNDSVLRFCAILRCRFSVGKNGLGFVGDLEGLIVIRGFAGALACRDDGRHGGTSVAIFARRRGKQEVQGVRGRSIQYMVDDGEDE